MSEANGDLVIRPMHPDDAPALSEMANLPGFRWGTGRMPFTMLARTQALIARLPEDATFLVATRNGVVIGTASLECRQGRQSHAALLHMGVHDAHAGQGVGTALLAALTDTADRWLGLRRLELTVYVDNAPALALYRRFGFEVEGTLRCFALRDGRFVDAHIMGRVSPPPAWEP